MKAKKKHGWILQANNGKVVMENFEESKTIGRAEVFSTRDVARQNRCLPDVVRKVELTRTGKAKRFIPER